MNYAITANIFVVRLFCATVMIPVSATSLSILLITLSFWD